MSGYVIKIFLEKNGWTIWNSCDPDQTLHSVASDLGLHCLQITLSGVSRLQWVKQTVKSKATAISYHQLRWNKNSLSIYEIRGPTWSRSILWEVCDPCETHVVFGVTIKPVPDKLILNWPWNKTTSNINPFKKNLRHMQLLYSKKSSHMHTIQPWSTMSCLCWGFTAQSTDWGHVKLC